MTMTRPPDGLATALARVAEEAGQSVMRSLHHAGLADEVSAGSLADISAHEAARATKSVPEGSAQDWALWGLVMYLRGVEAARQGTIRDPEAIGEWFANAHLCAVKALAVPLPVTERAPATLAPGIKMAHEVERDGIIGLAIEGYASRYDELDAQGQTMGRQALQGIFEEWAADPRPPIYWEHGRGAQGWRPLGVATDVQLTDEGLYIVGWLPRDADPRRFSGAARPGQRQAYEMVRTGKARGLSVGGTYQNVGPELRVWNCNDVSIGRTPILASARFTLRPATAM